MSRIEKQGSLTEIRYDSPFQSLKFIWWLLKRTYQVGLSTNQSNICSFETLFDPIAIEAFIQNENIICCLINPITFLGLKFHSLISAGSYLFNKAALSLLLHVVPCYCMLFCAFVLCYIFWFSFVLSVCFYFRILLLEPYRTWLL